MRANVMKKVIHFTFKDYILSCTILAYW